MNNYFEVIGISSPGSVLDEVSENEGIKVIPLKMTRKITPIRDFVALIKLILILKRSRPDIVHTHTPKAGLLGMLASYFIKVPIRLHTVAGLPLIISTGFKRKLLVFIEKLTYACATKVYPNSMKLQAYIVENKFCKLEKLKIIGKGSSNGIDTDFFSNTITIQKQADCLKKEYLLPENAFIMTFVGRIVKDKGINELIKAFSHLHISDVYLILVGGYENDLNPIDADVQQQIKENERIIEAGYQNDIRPFLSLSDVFVFPSYREGFPNVVLQAQAMDVPAIVSDINGCNEIIDDGINGLIIKPKDVISLENAMKRVLTNSSLLEKMKVNCRNNIIENYERSYIWNELHNEYENLLRSV